MIITLLTDFGDQDGFVGALRGVLLARAPSATLADIAHHVPPGDVAKAARVLVRAAPCFPRGTVHLVVVDPGVGSDRRPVALRAGGHLLVGPDNGVLIPAVEALGGVEAAHEAADRALWRAPVSATFHGRDIFAPVAGALAAGRPLDRVGPAIDPATLVRPEAPPPGPDGAGRWRGRVIEVDRFGNLITDLPGDLARRLGAPADGLRVEIAGLSLGGPAPAYAAVAPGEPVLVVGSEGTLEIAVRDGSAAGRLAVGVGAPVICTAAGAGDPSPPAEAP